MASSSTSHARDVEAQRDVSQSHHGIHGTTNYPFEMDMNASRAPADIAQPVLSESQAIGGEDLIHETSIEHSERENTSRQTQTGVERGEVQPAAGTQAQHVADHGPGDPIPNDSSREPRMIGDFNGSTNALWSLYGKEAKSHDEARIQPLKEDMDGVLIFAGLFSAALTSFVVDSKQNLQVNPTDQMVYYLQQHSTILSQISQQIASIAPQVSIPSTPPPPFPPFSPSASDIRINAFYFTALAFSLSAALLAILVQQWVRNYMHVFQRYSDPQKSARIRQYLYEGSEKWYMPIAAEAVPGLLHVSLFLFFAGLADSTLNINTTIGLSTTVPIGICGLLYIFTTFVPVIYPQSPYQTSFSGVIWYAFRKLRGRVFKDRDGRSKPVSTNMAQGQMQLSTEKTNERNGRDKRAILWLLDNLTEDAEIESFVMSARDSLEVWTNSSKEDGIPVVAERSSSFSMIRDVFGFIFPHQSRTSTSIHSSANSTVHRRALHSANTHRSVVATPIHERTTIRDFCWRINNFFNTCKNRGVFTSDELWRMRARACVEAMASLVSFASVEADWFETLSPVLGEIGSFEGMPNLSLSGLDEAFVVRWTCLSILALPTTLRGKFPKNLGRTNLRREYPKNLPWTRFLRFDAPDKMAQEADKTLEHQWKTERESSLSSKISSAAGIIREFEDNLGYNYTSIDLNEKIHKVIQRLTHQLPGANFDFPGSEPFLQQTFDLSPDPAKLRFISSRQPLNKFLDYLDRISSYQDNSPNLEYEQKQVIEEVNWPKHLLQRWVWSLDDLLKGGFGFTLELFLVFLKHQLSTLPSHKSYSALYIGTFRAITSWWRQYGRSSYHTCSHYILLDVVVSDQGFLRTFNYPDYITDEVWELLGDMFEGQADHIHIVVQKLRDLRLEDDGRHWARASALISRLRPAHLQGPSALISE